MFEFKEDLVLKNRQNSIEVRHLVLKGTNYDIGVKLAHIAKERHSIKHNISKDPFLTLCQKKYLEINYPIHLERMKGFSHAYGSDLSDNSIDFSMLGNPVDNISCSAIYYPPGSTESSHGILSKNLDFNTKGMFGRQSDCGALSKPYIAEIYPDKGYSSLIIFSYELFGQSLEGINSEGLIVTHLADCETPGESSKEATLRHSIGINEMQSIQLLLDTCSNVEEAKKALLINKHYYMMVPVHLLIGDKYGNSFIWEFCNAPRCQDTDSEK